MIENLFDNPISVGMFAMTLFYAYYMTEVYAKYKSIKYVMAGIAGYFIILAGLLWFYGIGC
ncbi:hypothetical protein MMKA1_08950 [Methanococcus maripaludis KA1]|uniref:Uncharacterized protein n=1 Tax=Methanococcus maripaludis KA1 TaxID=637914 RepID=A0A2Z5PDA3_METMI|nr:hypothetical protein [Methanococcus maripaludis]BAP61012.1 hypothetical protein MMKA1_08950 [Methanococcus maripaludis KA1]